MTHAGLPFVVFSLPRSRSFWLSRFLSYGNYECHHEQSRHIRGVDDLRSWLAQGWTGTAETAAAPWYRLLRHLRPDLAIVVVRRPVDEVVDSLMRLDLQGVCTFDRAVITRQMHRIDRYLDRIERLPGVLSVRFADLADEATCARVFEHCLHVKHDPAWWAALAETNLQCNMPALMRYMILHERQVSRTAARCLQHMKQVRRDARAARAEPGEDGIVLEECRFDRLWQDAQPLFAEHSASIGWAPGEYHKLDWGMLAVLDEVGALHTMTARMNGRMLGYLISILAPCLEHKGKITATQTLFFACEDAKGLRLGMRIQKASIEALRARGVFQVAMRAGIRGSGPRLGAVFKRLGAMENGHLYTLDLKAA
jgi:hypothetical protein